MIFISYLAELCAFFSRKQINRKLLGMLRGCTLRHSFISVIQKYSLLEHMFLTKVFINFMASAKDIL